jgi:hypothetical protein
LMEEELGWTLVSGVLRLQLRHSSTREGMRRRQNIVRSLIRGGSGWGR